MMDACAPETAPPNSTLPKLTHDSEPRAPEPVTAVVRAGTKNAEVTYKKMRRSPTTVTPAGNAPERCPARPRALLPH